MRDRWSGAKCISEEAVIRGYAQSQEEQQRPAAFTPVCTEQKEDRRVTGQEEGSSHSCKVSTGYQSCPSRCPGVGVGAGETGRKPTCCPCPARGVASQRLQSWLGWELGPEAPCIAARPFPETWPGAGAASLAPSWRRQSREVRGGGAFLPRASATLRREPGACEGAWWSFGGTIQGRDSLLCPGLACLGGTPQPGALPARRFRALETVCAHRSALLPAT